MYVSFTDKMQSINTQTGLSGTKVTGVSIGNGSSLHVANNGQAVIPDNFIFEEVDPSADDENDDSDSDTSAFAQIQGHSFQQGLSNTGLKPGKKTKGRVKIKMEFIENKLRRYTTFSKRKTGIMKKAYELSTLTGTQVMLLVASETGHVYTFATRKLQPMITSDSGKALIQTCLNSPDPPPGTPSGNVQEQRMNPSGFEETELTCTVGEEEQKTLENGYSMKPVFPIPTQVVTSGPVMEQKPSAVTLREVTPVASAPSNPIPTFTLQPSHTGQHVLKEQMSSKPVLNKTSSGVSASLPSSASSSISTMQIPVIFPQGAISMIQSQPSSQPTISLSQSSEPQSVLKPAALSQVVSAISSQTVSSTQNSQTGELNTPLPASTPSAINIMQGMTPGIVMYHTPQGVVYATPTHNIQENTIFNFPQTATTIQVPQSEQSTGQQQHVITIPVPVSLSGKPLLQLAPPPSAESSVRETTPMQPPPLKKTKK